MVIQALLVFFAWMLLNLVIKEKPELPPSKVAEVPYEGLDFTQSYQAIKSNKNFGLLIIAFGLPYGAQGAIGTLQSNFLTPFNFSASELAFTIMGL